MQRHLVIMAAGTGGHVIPGLAVAREMQRARLERQLARHHARHGEPPRCRRRGIALDAISFAGLRGKGVIGTLTGGLRLLEGVLGLPAHPARARRAARCSAWAATCAFPAA